MSKHTPGPWFRMGDTVGNFAPRYTTEIVYESQRHNSKDGYWPICFMTDEPPTNELESNARLIAAAPDLLEALRSITDAADEKRVTAKHYEIARAAIAKATGEME